MQSITLVLCVLCVASHLVFSMPVEQSESAIQQKVPLDQQETLITLDLADPKQEISARDKRTIGVLRQWFPGVSQILDNVIQSITRYLFRVIGRLVLRGGFLGGGGGGGGGGGDSSSSSGSSGRRISITLPTYPPSAEDEEEEDNSEPPTATELNPEDENKLAGAESQVNEVRVQYTAPEDQGFSDQDSAASGGNEEVEGEVDGVADESRDKRYSGFGSGSDGGDAEAHGGSGGGSGNFLFDIIRLVTGGSGSASSGSSSSGGEHTEEGATAEAHAEKDAGYEAGIPGPITRLFVIANRGIANLIQDLILRLAQTSERIVNFKARLITSII